MSAANLLQSRVIGATGEPPSHPRVAPPTIETIMASRVSSLLRVSSRAPIIDALALLGRADLGAIIVDGESGTGVFARADLVRACLQLGETALQAPVGDWAQPCACFASTTTTLHECRDMMLGGGLRHLPIRRGDQIVDLLSFEEVLAWLAGHYQDIIRAKNVDQQVMFLQGTYSC